MTQHTTHVSSPLLSVQGLSLSYQGQPPVLDGFSLDIDPGEFIMLEGPSGSGKSTLLRVLVRLEEPDEGRILFRGRPVRDLPPQELRTRVRLMPQLPVMSPGTVRDNLLLPFGFRQNRHLSPSGKDLLKKQLEDVQLHGEMLDRPAGSLSVGQQQRVALLRTCMVPPQVLLLDEPTSGLDRTSRAIVEASLIRLNRDQGIAVVLVSHHDLQSRKTFMRRVMMGGDGRPGEAEYDRG